MATNNVQTGAYMQATVPDGGWTSGQAVLIGSIFGVSTGTYDAGEIGVVALGEVWELPKADDEISQGDELYFDAAEGELTTVSDGNVYAGAAFADAGVDEDVVRILINAVRRTLGESKVLHGSAALDFAAINGAAYEDKTIAVVGAAVNDAVSPGPPAAPTAGIVYQYFVSAADVVTVRAINITADPINPAAQTHAVAVHKA